MLNNDRKKFLGKQLQKDKDSALNNTNLTKAGQQKCCNASKLFIKLNIRMIF